MASLLDAMPSGVGEPWFHGGARIVFRANLWASTNSSDVDDRSGVALEALAQLDELRLVGQEGDVVVGDLVGEGRLEAGW
jgi:hypothetical protein